jgi:hypothetical protein
MNTQFVNYNLARTGEYPRWAKMEDNDLIATGRSIIEKHSFGNGGIAIAQVIFTDLMNFNFRKFRKDKIEQSAKTFYDPVYTPFLMHHDQEGYNREVPVGRNIFAKYISRKIETDRGVASGYIKVVTFIPKDSKLGDQTAIDAMKSRLILGVSMGASIPREHYLCSVCGNSLMSSDCDHTPGMVYDGDICCIDTVSPFRFKEYSGVHTPAEVESMIKRLDTTDSEGLIKPGPAVEYNSGPFSFEIYDNISKVHSPGGIKDEKIHRSKNMEIKQMIEALHAVNEVVKDYEETVAKQSELITTLSTSLSDKIKAVSSLEADVTSLKGEIDTLKDGIGSKDSDNSNGAPDDSTDNNTSDAGDSSSGTENSDGTQEDQTQQTTDTLKNYRDIMKRNKKMREEIASSQLTLFQ